MRPANSDGRCISSEILQRDCVSVPAGGSINEPEGVLLTVLCPLEVSNDDGETM